MSTSAISNTRCLELSLCRTFYLVSSTLMRTIGNINSMKSADFGHANSEFELEFSAHDYFFIPRPLLYTVYIYFFYIQFGCFNILVNFPYKSVRYLELRYFKPSLSPTIFLVASVIFGLFPYRYLEHSNEVFHWIILFIPEIRMLIASTSFKQ